MQSGAFVQVLLMLISIASRMRLISAELVEILTSVKTCLTRLRGVAVVTTSVRQLETNVIIGSTYVSSQASDTNRSCPLRMDVMDFDATEVSVDPSETLKFGAEIHRTVPKSPIVAATKVAEASTLSECSQIDLVRISQQNETVHNLPEPKRKKVQTEIESPGGNAMPVAPKKKKRKVVKNEIDDIFGF